MSIACVPRAPLGRRDKDKKVKLFKGLGNPTRIDIIDLLMREGEMRPTDIAVFLGEPQANISHHLRDMVKEDLLYVRNSGRERFYSISPTMADDIADAMSL